MKEMKERIEQKGVKKNSGFTLIELIVVMAVVGILVLLAAPKFLGYTERARETKHIHTAKVIETALEAYLINGGAFPDDLEVVDKTLLEEAANKETLIGVNGYVSTVDEEVYYELTYDFIQKLDVKLSAKNALLIEANASSVPTAVYASERGITMVDKEKTMKGYEIKPGEMPNEIKTEEVKQLAAGEGHSLVLKKDGTVWAWGRNNNGQLGNGTMTSSSTPIKSNLTNEIVDIAAGDNYSLAIDKNGNAWAWGYNALGQLGDGTTSPQMNPVQVKGLSNVKSIVGAYDHTLALTKEGNVYSWGVNNFGQLGREAASSTVHTNPGKVALSDVVAIESGKYFSMAIKKDGTVWAWGLNNYGQLGIGTTENKPSPVQITTITDVKSIALGINHSIAVKKDGSIYGWGHNVYGQLGDGTFVNKNTPTLITAFSNPITVTTDGNHTLALKKDGTVLAWGYNATGQLGDEKTTNQSLPISVKGIAEVVSIAGGYNHSLAIEKDGTVWSWGKNDYYQLGDGTMINKNAPIQVKNSNGSFLTTEKQD